MILRAVQQQIGLISWIVTFALNDKTVDLFILSQLLMSSKKDLKTFVEFLVMHSNIFMRVLLRALFCFKGH